MPVRSFDPAIVFAVSTGLSQSRWTIFRHAFIFETNGTVKSNVYATPRFSPLCAKS